jgi:hypothetical protein
MPRWARTPFLAGVFHFPYLGQGVGQLDQEGMGIAAGENDTNRLRTDAQGIGDPLFSVRRDKGGR